MRIGGPPGCVKIGGTPGGVRIGGPLGSVRIRGPPGGMWIGNPPSMRIGSTSGVRIGRFFRRCTDWRSSRKCEDWWLEVRQAPACQ